MTIVVNNEETDAVKHNYTSWAASNSYSVGDVVVYNGIVYVCSTAHTSSTTFDSSNWSESTSVRFEFNNVEFEKSAKMDEGTRFSDM